jgi:GTP-binding protein Era
MDKEFRDDKFRSGYAAIIGRPNVGKSTLLNTVLGRKVSIVTPKPQTTRNRILGIKTEPHAQIIFIDTPGLHRPKTKMGELMVREARESLREVDIVLFITDPRPPTPKEEDILKTLSKVKKPIILVINKIDTVRKPKLLPVIEAYSKIFPFKEVIPISALKGDGIEILLEAVLKYLPPGPQYYPSDLVTDQLERFMVSEIIREKVMEITEEEVPHAVAVEVVSWEERAGTPDVAGPVHISANIWVEREGQKGIIIGKNGQRLKEIGRSARADIEALLDAKVFLELWVKIKKGWREDMRAIGELGIK